MRACCTKQQRIQRLGGGIAEIKQTQAKSRMQESGQTAGKQNIDREQDQILCYKKEGGKALASPGNSSLNSQMKMRSGTKQFGIRGTQEPRDAATRLSDRMQLNIRLHFLRANRKAEQIVGKRKLKTTDFELGCPEKQATNFESSRARSSQSRTKPNQPERSLYHLL